MTDFEALFDLLKEPKAKKMKLKNVKMILFVLIV